MNREIEFRGYCPDLGRWIYGDLFHFSGQSRRRKELLERSAEMKKLLGV